MDKAETLRRRRKRRSKRSCAPTSKDKCTKTGKERFDNELDAISFGFTYCARNKGRNLAFRQYRCDFCKGWHLTTKLF
jgi:hypothetical protein